jgi:type IX secretion system PorP/SprF family membrane protein
LLKTLYIFVFIFVYQSVTAQQYPWWTQYRNNQTLYNPAFCGTKRLMDLRVSYRNQWTGFEGSPKSYVLSLNSRLMNGKIGVGGFIFKDDIGPFRTINSSLTGAFHLKFEDSELSIGVQGNYLKQRFIGNNVTLRNQQDKAINQYTEDVAGNFDGSFGVVYFNDRFHLGIGANNIASSKLEYYKNDSLKKGFFKNAPHTTFSAGYNWADNPDYIFEHSVLAMYVSGVPITFDYTLRLHIKQQIIAGLSFRVKDAIALQLGYTIKEKFQICYSYDFITSPLRKYQYGTHELTLIFSSNLGRDQKKQGLDKRFVKQRYDLTN